MQKKIIALIFATALTSCSEQSTVQMNGISNVRMVTWPVSGTEQYWITLEDGQQVTRGGRAVYLNHLSQLEYVDETPVRLVDGSVVFMNEQGLLVSIINGLPVYASINDVLEDSKGGALSAYAGLKVKRN